MQVLATSEGGIGRHVRSIATGLSEHGIPVSVAGPESTDRVFGYRAAGLPFHPIEIANTPRPTADLAAARRLRRLAAGADLVHAHGLRAGFVAGLALVGPDRAARAPLVVTWHNAVLTTGIQRRVLAGLERTVARSATLTLGASSDLVDRAWELGARDARLGPVAAPPLPPAERDGSVVRAELDAGDRPVILAVGRLAPQKSYQFLLSAARHWAERRPQPLVVIAGEGPERPVLQAEIDAHALPVRLLGHRSDIADLLGAADLVALTSRWEARALIAQEALRAGRPLVATAVGGLPELVGRAAVLVPYGDAGALAAAVDRLLDDPLEAARFAQAGPIQAARWPTEAETIDQLLARYDELAPARSAR
ncbi:MAG TPA: glycosyltransferase family 4 protein [Actinomycetes bacterium]|nr:glycosyltransferase family 4 protein [Actinomycetes bacterium]